MGKYDKQLRYIFNESPNQPVGEFLGKEYMRLKENANEPLNCSICLGDICCDKCICLLMCGHSFHLLCIQKTQICPLCRK